MRNLLSHIGQEVKFNRDIGVLRRFQREGRDFVYLECKYPAPTGEPISLPVVCSSQFYHLRRVNDDNEIILIEEGRQVA